MFKIRIFHEINKKENFKYKHVGRLKSIIMYSALGLDPFCMNYCLNTVWHGCYISKILEFFKFHL